MLASLVPLILRVVIHPATQSHRMTLQGIHLEGCSTTSQNIKKTMKATSVVLPISMMFSRLFLPWPSSSYPCGVTQDRTGQDSVQTAVHKTVELTAAHCCFFTACTHLRKQSLSIPLFCSGVRSITLLILT